MWGTINIENEKRRTKYSTREIIVELLILKMKKKD